MAIKKMTLWDLIAWHREQEKQAVLNDDGEDRFQTPRKAKEFHRRAIEVLEAAYAVSVRAAIEDVASFIENFDHSVDHPWRLSDVVRLKFNLIGHNRVRINHAAHNARERAKNSRFKTLPGA